MKLICSIIRLSCLFKILFSPLIFSRFYVMPYLMKNKKFYFLIIFSVALLFSSLRIIKYFPTSNFGDEVTYYLQAKNVAEYGIYGYQLNAKAFLNDSISQLYPPPIRIAHIFFDAIALKFSNTFIALSYLSLIFYLLHCIVSIFYIKKIWGPTASFLAGLLICFSPLSCGLAGRALSESGYYLFFTLSLFIFIDYLTKPNLIKMILFILFFSLCIQIRESAVFILPFFSGMLLIQKFYLKKSLKIIYILTLVLSPLLISLCIYIFVLGDINKVVDIFMVIGKINIAVPHTYILWYNSGPWYQYFVDYFMLSPFTSLLFLLFAGYYIPIQKNWNQQLNILFLFFIYFIVVYSFLPKNVRYAQSLDLIYRIGSALMIIKLFANSNLSTQIKKAIFVSSFTLLIINDLFSYRNFFIIHNIYDPMSYNLLTAAGFFAG